MNGGVKFLASAAFLMAGGCGGEQGKLQIRPTPTPLSATVKPVPFRIAEAASHLALGNVALALESFRKALREDPTSVEAMAGLAACYDQMARFDLSRRYYESALALAPSNTGLLNAFARSLDAQGGAEEAAAVRREIGMRLAAASPRPLSVVQTPARQQLLTVVPAPIVSPSVTMVLAPARPIAIAEAERPQAPPRQPVAAATVDRSIAPLPKPVAVAAVERPVAPAPKPVAVAAVEQPKAPSPVRVAAPAARQSVTLLLPPPQPIAVAEAKRPASPLPTSAPVAAATAPSPQAPSPVIVARKAPANPLRTPDPALRLERMSLGEVTLVTTGRPQWRSKLVSRTAQSATIRYVPLRTAQARPVQIRLLNAARHQGLAARTRNLLADRGWRQLAIGDANQVRRTSLILYPPNRRETAVRLGAQFGIPIAKRASGNEFVMLIGRDLAKRTAPRARG